MALRNVYRNWWDKLGKDIDGLMLYSETGSMSSFFSPIVVTHVIQETKIKKNIRSKKNQGQATTHLEVFLTPLVSFFL